MSGLLPVNTMPLAYEGTIAVPYLIRNFAPTTSNNQFSVPTIWVNPSTQEAWILVAKPQGVADWELLTGSSGTVIGILTPDGNTAVPVDGIINFLNGTGISITSVNDTNNITFNAIGGGFTWNNVTAASQTLAPGNGYVADRTSLITFTLPATAAFGDSYVIAGLGSGGWTITQNSGQSIIVGKNTTTTTTGSVSSTLASDTITIVCITANTTFKALPFVGNLTIV